MFVVVVGIFSILLFSAARAAEIRGFDMKTIERWVT